VALNSPASACARRAKFGLLTGVLLIAATASLVVANMLAERYSTRWDVTATREHELTPRTGQLLSRLKGEYEIVIGAPLRDRRTIDPAALQRVRDVLDQFSRGAAIKTTLIDTGSPAGVADFGALLKRLADREDAAVRKDAGVFAAALTGTEQLAGELIALVPKLQSVRDAIPESAPGAATNRSYFDQRAAESDINARALRDLVAKARTAGEAPAGQLPIPDTEHAAAPLRQPLADVQAGLADMTENLRRFAAADSMPAAAREAAKPVVEVVSRVRDRAALVHDSLERVGKLDLLRVARTLQSGSAALIIGPPEAGLTAVELSRLLPPPASLTDQSGARADVARNAEELLTTAIATLAQPIRPIVIFVHGTPSHGLLQSTDFRGLLDLLSLRGIDAVEWAATVDAEPPSIARLDPTGKRPVVCVVLSTDAAQNVQMKGQSGPERAAKLGQAVGAIINDGHPLLLCLSPSTLPTFGEPDPMLTSLAAFGLTADSGRPLLKERFTADGRHVDSFQSLVARDEQQPIARAVRGLLTRFEWPIAIKPAKETPAGVHVTPLFTVDDKSVWAESQWLSFWQMRPQDQETSPNKPTRDARDESGVAWNVAVAATRPVAGQDDERLIIVGSNTWFMDRVAQERMLVDGRPALTNPGNAELFEAAVYWLAGQDDMISSSPTARAVALIRPVSGATLLALRWLAIAGLPGAVLLLGLLWRLVRG
jgi:hypothetical protein